MQKLIEKLGLSEGAASAALWVVLSLILLGVVALVALWLVRTLRPSLNIKAGDRGGRPQRLAITDAFALDREGRKLVIVRRDNVEHLLLIGGPNDVLVEGNITRHDRAARGLPRAADSEFPDEASPPPVATLPPAPAPVAPPPAPPRPRLEESERPVVERRPIAPLAPILPPAPEPRRAEPPMTMTAAPEAPEAPVVVEPPVAPPAPPTLAAAPPVLTLEALLPDATPVSMPSPPPAPEPVAPQPPAPPAPAPRAPAMSEMARRLNEALQKPVSGTLRPPFNRSIPPAPPTARSAPPPAPSPVPPAPEPAPVVAEPPPPPAPELKLAQAEPEPVVAKADMDLLEEEMARLLGRPSAPKGPGVS